LKPLWEEQELLEARCSAWEDAYLTPYLDQCTSKVETHRVRNQLTAVFQDNPFVVSCAFAADRVRNATTDGDSVFKFTTESLAELQAIADADAALKVCLTVWYGEYLQDYVEHASTKRIIHDVRARLPYPVHYLDLLLIWQLEGLD
jgi:hypothetical protein